MTHVMLTGAFRNDCVTASKEDLHEREEMQTSQSESRMKWGGEWRREECV